MFIKLAEILNNCGVTVKLFADDVKDYVEIVENYSSDILQGALD